MQMPVNESYRTVLHPGFAKAMSSMFQDVVFKNHPEINHIGKPFWNSALPAVQSFSAANFIRRIVGYDSIAFDTSKVFKLYQESIAKRLEINRLNSISDESLTYAVNADRALIAKRLHKFFPKAKIFFSIRNQPSALYSLYKWRRNERYSTQPTFGEWLESMNNVYNDRFVDYEFEMFNYYKVINIYVDIFGRENVCVLPMELLRQCPDDYAINLSDFLYIDRKHLMSNLTLPAVNKQPCDLEISLKRWLHWFRILLGYCKSSVDLMIQPSILKSSLITALFSYKKHREIKYFKIPDDLLRIYIDGNTKIEDEFKLNLKSFGYPIESNNVYK